MYYIGLMSGTSTDAVDGVLANADMNIIASYSLSIPGDLQHKILELNSRGDDELAKSALVANDLADLYGQVVNELLNKSNLKTQDIKVIGAHGQTVRHVPEQGYSIQLNSPARLVEKTGIAVIADFRSRDIAAGGQGAPLVPAFHAAIFGQQANRAVLNLGGIANLTILDKEISGFDTGPANMLMDAWIQKHHNQPYDKDGAWAASGKCQPALLELLLSEPWLSLRPPKSTGRDLFNLEWLEQKISQCNLKINPADVQATLLELSIQTISTAIKNYAANTKEIIICGGGSQNAVFVQQLQESLPLKITSSDYYGIPAQYMEALAFAWLAKANLDGASACLPSVTGAKHPSIAGCIYPV